MLIKESERATMDPQKDVCLQIFGKQIFNSFLESLSLSPSNHLCGVTAFELRALFLIPSVFPLGKGEG